MGHEMKATFYLKSGVVEVWNLESIDWQVDSRGVRSLKWRSKDPIGDHLLHIEPNEIVAIKATKRDPSSRWLYVASAGFLCIVTAVVAHAIYLSIT